MGYLTNIIILFCIYTIFTLSLNMVVGLAGLFLFAYVVFYGLGAYTVSILMTAYGLNFWLSLFIGMTLNGVVAYLVSQILSEFKRGYRSILSITLLSGVFFVLLNFKILIKDILNIYGIGKSDIEIYTGFSQLPFLISVLLITIAFGVVSVLINKSSFGRTLKSLRENEKLTAFLGYQTQQYKTFIFTLSAIMTGVAGSLFTGYIAFVDPTSFQLAESVLFFTMIAVGVSSSILEGIIIAVLLLMISECLHFCGLPYETAALVQRFIGGAVLAFVMFFCSQRLFGKDKVWKKWH